MGDSMGKEIVKIYGDGEIWTDGRKKGKIYPDGEIYVDGKLFGRIYEDGEIWVDGKRAGRVFTNGDVWIGNQKVATGVYLLELLGNSAPPPQQEFHSGSSRAGSFSSAASRFSDSATNASGGGVGCAALFVAVLLIVAFIYAIFRFWLTELPTLLFGNMQVMGTVAMLSVYVCMVLVAYIHCCLATQKDKMLFFQALLMQAAAFFANIIVFTILDMIAIAFSYGLSIGDVLGELGGALGGSFFGMLVIAVFVGLAPTLVRTLISFICIKKGKTISFPAKLKNVHFSVPTGKSGYQKRTVNFTAKSKYQPKTSSFTASTAKSSYRKRTWSPTWDTERIMKVLVCLCFTGIITFFLSTLPMSLFLSMEEISFEMGRLILPALAVAAGIYLRRKLWNSYHDSFILGWLVQSAVQIAACLLNWALENGIFSIFSMPDVVASCCGMCLLMSLMLAFFTLPLVKE